MRRSGGVDVVDVDVADIPTAEGVATVVET